MRIFITILAVTFAAALWAAAPTSQPGTTTRPAPVYPGGAQTLSNRLHASLFDRTDRQGRPVGRDELDPLLFNTSRHLSTGNSHRQTVDLLDEFIRNPAPGSPLERAVLQDSLSAVFDWTAQRPFDTLADGFADTLAGRALLRSRLAKAIRHATLKGDEVAQLPDNYAAAVAAKTFAGGFDPAQPTKPFLPPDLFDKQGPWVCVGSPKDGPGTVSARDHAAFFNGRSAFIVFLNLPGGREATMNYLAQLGAVADPTTRPSADRTRLRDDLPQFPAGTQVALVRRMLLLTDTDQITASPVTLNVQLRVYTRVLPGVNMLPDDQQSFELVLDRRSLLAGGAGLHAVTADQIAYIGFSGIFGPHDPFEPVDPRDRRSGPALVLQTCKSCHTASGIYSVNTYSNQNAAPRPAPHLSAVESSEEIQRAVSLRSRLISKSLTDASSTQRSK